MECYLLLGLTCLIYQQYGAGAAILTVFGLTVFMMKVCGKTPAGFYRMDGYDTSDSSDTYDT